VSLRVLQPATWAGYQKGGFDSPMVCGACPDWQRCSEANRCERASDEDYRRALPAQPVVEEAGPELPDWSVSESDGHSWLHRCFPPQPTVCILCGVQQGTPEAARPCMELL
jgi:hypothetical protein